MGIKVSEKNPRFFDMDGRVGPLFGSGMDGVPRDPLLSRMIAAGVNTFRMQVSFLKGSPLCPWKGTDTWDNNFGGWNDAAFRKLRYEANRLLGKGCYLLLVIESSPARRHLWEDHLWRQRNGGYVSNPYSRVPSLFNYGQDVFLKFLRKLLVYEMPESEFPNVLVALNWEIFNGWQEGGASWAKEMIRFCHGVNRNRPFGVGTYKHEQLLELNKAVRRPAFGIAEGADTFWLVNKSRKPKGWPWVGCGYHCHPDAFYGQDEERICSRFRKGKEIENFLGAVGNIGYAVTSGISPSFPFEHWQRKTGHITKSCGKDFRYDYEMFNELLHLFTKPFSRFLEEEVDFLKVPGFWINRKIRKRGKKILRRILHG
jgi:hypothetical protein